MQQPLSCHFVQRWFSLCFVFIVVASFFGGLFCCTDRACAQLTEDDLSLHVQRPDGIRQTDILFDPNKYTAFPHVVRLEGDELLLTFRQAPREQYTRHSHPQSIITIVRSYDLGETWDVANATQMAAGGGQELSTIYLGDGHVGGLLAMHEVVPVAEAHRIGKESPAAWPRAEYPNRGVGGFWCWSENFGLNWLLHHTVLFAPGMHPCAAPIRLESGMLLAPVYGSLQEGQPTSAVAHFSRDGGKTWSGPTMLAQGSRKTRAYAEPVVLELSPNHLLAMHRVEEAANGRDGLFWRNQSLDGGQTWSDPVETELLSGACVRLMKLSDGRILATYGRRVKPLGIYARLSDDGGQTWGKTSWLLRECPTMNQGYSSSLEVTPGRVLTVCYAHDAAVGPTTADGVYMAPNSGITGTFWDLPSRSEDN